MSISTKGMEHKSLAQCVQYGGQAPIGLSVGVERKADSPGLDSETVIDRGLEFVIPEFA